jgi:hypothetical protein
MSILRAFLFVTLAVASAQALTCNPVSFWVEEGLLLQGDLQAPPAVRTNFNNNLWTGAPTQTPAVSCAGTLTFSAQTVPQKHFATPNGYTPIVTPFQTTFQTNGKFNYINVPTFGQPNVWNGYDAFTYQATCVVGATTETCTSQALINVVFTSAATQNSPRPSFAQFYTTSDFLQCTGSCKNGAEGLWMARHTLPRLWDMQRNEAGDLVKDTISTADGVKATDGLEFEYSSNFALVTTYGAIGNMAVRFPTFELVAWKPGTTFDPSSVSSTVASLSTGFDADCLQYQGASGAGSDVWVFNTNQVDGTLGSKYRSSTSWYQKFGGKHNNCDVFKNDVTIDGVRNSCRYAPLLTPRMPQIENNGGVWKLAVDGCNLRWQGKFTWNAMRNQNLKNGNKAFLISSAVSGAYTITGEIYNQAVQPNSWTDPSRGFASIDHKYLLKVTLAQDTNFQFELGVDIFTVDLQQFRYFKDNQHAFGYNMITYPKTLNSITPQSQPDRRVIGYKWVEHRWIAPNPAQCPGCGSVGLGVVSQTGVYSGSLCTDDTTLEASYNGDLPNGNCPSGTGTVFLYKGPQTSGAVCSNVDPMVILNKAGISPQDPSGGACKTGFQNVTLRGVAIGSQSEVSTAAGFGFEGKITLTFLLANGEHPHFVIEPKLYTKSISIESAFAGTSSTCRGSPSWPVANDQQLPQYLCEEVDARTFGPTDWAIIFFDIKDVDSNLVELVALKVVLGSLQVRFVGPVGPGEQAYQPSFTYFNFRNLKTNAALLANPTAPAGVNPPKDMDFGFAFTPGAHNENAKVTIYCTLRIKSSTMKHSARRFLASEVAKDTENTVQERINIQRDLNAPSSSLTTNSRVVESGSTSDNSNAASSSSGVTVIVLAAACAVLLAAVIGMVLYVVRQSSTAIKRVHSSA